MELAEFDFEVRYRPGTSNEAADFLSRLSEPKKEEIEGIDAKFLPKELKMICEVSGGGDSMMESLLIAMKEAVDNEEINIELPKKHIDLRQTLVEEVSKNIKQYGLPNGKEMRQKLKIMKMPGQQPLPELLLAASKLFNIRVLVYHGMRDPIVFTHGEPEGTIRLQCVSMIHYNPLYLRREFKEEIKPKLVNCLQPMADVECVVHDLEELPYPNQIESNDLECHHWNHHIEVQVSQSNTSYCALFDTGAQVSLVSRDLVNSLNKRGENIVIKKVNSNLVGLGEAKEAVEEVVELQIVIRGQMMCSLPFAVVPGESIPSCLLLGANFISKNQIEIDFKCSKIGVKHVSGYETFMINSIDNDDLTNDVYFGVISSKEESSDNQCELRESKVSEIGTRAKYLISDSELVLMQKRNHVLKELFSKIKKGIPNSQWKSKSLKPFKRSEKFLKINNGLLVHEVDGVVSVVVSFSFMVDIITKTHEKMNHLGRHKLFHVVKAHFWYPGLDKICLDLCRSCNHCQFFKTHNLSKTPPIVKISSNYPFELLCVDLLQLPRTNRGNVALLVCVDHYSKWLCVVPIKNKKSVTVAEALRDRVLSSLPSIPLRLLSDNGPEFLGHSFKKVLDHHNIVHCHSSPYHPSGNGASERANRTIIQLLIDGEDIDWDLKISKIIINYNNTFHSETKTSPSQMILTKSYPIKPRLGLEAQEIQKWKEGHPSFCPYKLNQRVLKKIMVKGRELKNKLQKKFDGPYTITKVFSNGVSYNIQKEGSNIDIKVNHRQLRPFHEVPKYISRYVRESTAESADSSDEKTSPKFRRYVADSSSNTDSTDDEGICVAEATKSKASDCTISKMNTVVDCGFGSGTPNGTISDTSETAVAMPKCYNVSNDNSSVVIDARGRETQVGGPSGGPTQYNSERVVQKLQQRLSACNELISEAIVSASHLGDALFYLNDGFFMSSVSGPEDFSFEDVIHSTPINPLLRNVRSVGESSLSKNNSGLKLLESSEGKSFSGFSGNDVHLKSNNVLSIDKNRSEIQPNRDYARELLNESSASRSFHGFPHHDRPKLGDPMESIKKLFGLLDNAQKLINGKCSSGQGEHPLIDEVADTVGEIPVLNARTLDLRSRKVIYGDRPKRGRR